MRNITPINPPKPATKTVSILMGICTKGTKSTIKRSMSPKIICSKILIIKPATLNKIIRPIATITAKTIPKKIVSMIILCPYNLFYSKSVLTLIIFLIIIFKNFKIN